MKYLNDMAAQCFKQTSILSYELGLISHSQLLHRLDYLRALLSPSNSTHEWATKILMNHKEEMEDDWQVEQDTSSIITEESKSTPSSLKFNDSSDSPYDGYMSFIPNSQTGLQRWNFHQNDDDYFPSVPHGHEMGKKQPKLNPYSGHIYKKESIIGREARSRIILLWNDSKFREFAYTSINYYMTHHLSYNGWSVGNPLKLPRRRKLK